MDLSQRTELCHELEYNLSIRTSSKYLIQCTNYQNIYIHTFRKCFSFFLRVYFPKQPPEVFRKKKLFQKILQYSQENACVIVSC